MSFGTKSGGHIGVGTPKSGDSGERHGGWLHGYGKFLWEYVKKPNVIGAVAPSSSGLAIRMVEWLDLARARAVVEYGTGTGSFTVEIEKRRQRQCRYVGIEINPALARMFRERFPGLRLYEGSVRDVRRICDAEKIRFVDCIVCGLPWASFSENDQVTFMEALMSVLKKGGQFVTFAYLQGLLLPAGVRFRRMLRHYFREVSTSRTVWRNLPPAFVYRCRR